MKTDEENLTRQPWGRRWCIKTRSRGLDEKEPKKKKKKKRLNAAANKSISNISTDRTTATMRKQKWEENNCMDIWGNKNRNRSPEDRDMATKGKNPERNLISSYSSTKQCYKDQLAQWVERSPMVRKTEVQSQVKSYQRLKKWYLMPPCLILSSIR